MPTNGRWDAFKGLRGGLEKYKIYVADNIKVV
jgi:hypothetical protein